VRAPEGSLVNARPPAAVAGGNVETSSRIVDAVFARSDRRCRARQGQGTMNNVTLGNDRFTYYETIGGGQGACPDADGPSAIHVTMSNTLTTPVEALELSYPLRVERYALRLGAAAAAPPRRRRRGARAARARRLPALDPQRARTRAPRGARAARTARADATSQRRELPRR
jgi:N-methylhydantoinase B